MKYKLILVFSLFFALGFLNGCENSDDDLAAKMQKCMDDNPTVSEAESCISDAGGSSDERVLRALCALKFVKYGKDQSAMITAFASLKGNSGSGAAPLTNLAYNLAAPSAAAADDLIDTCERSKSGAMVLLANAAKLGYLITQTSCNNPDDCADNLDDLEDDELEEIGESIYSQHCTGGQAENEECEDLEQCCSGGQCEATCLRTNLQKE